MSLYVPRSRNHVKLNINKTKIVGRLKLEHQILGKHVRGSYRIVTGFIPDRSFIHIRRIFQYDFCMGQDLERFQR